MSLSYHPLFIGIQLGTFTNGLLPKIYVGGLLPEIYFKELLNKISISGPLPGISFEKLLPWNLSSDYYLEMLLGYHMGISAGSQIYEPHHHQRAYLNLKSHRGETTHPGISWGSYNCNSVSSNRWHRGDTTQPILFPTNILINDLEWLCGRMTAS